MVHRPQVMHRLTCTMHLTVAVIAEITPSPLSDKTMALTLREQIDCYPYVIFDMDGTLLNSEIWHHAAWNAMVHEFGFPKLPYELLLSYGGLPTAVITQNLCNLYHIQADCEAMGKRKTELYKTQFMRNAEAFPKAAALLKELYAEGKRIAVATSSHHEESEFLLKKNGLYPYIHALVTGDQVVRGKPNPDIYLLAASKLNAPADQCLVFEDTVVGMQGIKNAKMAAVKVFDGEYDCDHVILPDEEWTPTEHHAPLHPQPQALAQ